MSVDPAIHKASLDHANVAPLLRALGNANVADRLVHWLGAGLLDHA
jgi:hypothetical protein